jgi:hypothetical protein
MPFARIESVHRAGWPFCPHPSVYFYLFTQGGKKGTLSAEGGGLHLRQ